MTEQPPPPPTVQDVVAALKATIGQMAESHAMREAELVGEIDWLRRRIAELENGQDD